MEIIAIVLSGVSLLIAILIFIKINGLKGGSDSNEILKQILLEQEKLPKQLKEESSTNRQEANLQQKELRQEIITSISTLGANTTKYLTALTEKNEEKMSKIQQTVQDGLLKLQKDNSVQLERMRNTVDEKLTETLDKRLGEKFKMVNDRLESVYKGLGEMQNLAKGVGDLKNVLTNVKTRGTWGEVQLDNLLEQILAPTQFLKNVSTKKGSNDRVEFAIKIPSKTTKDENVLLPIDVKFPVEDYQRLLDAVEQADKDAVDRSVKAITNKIKDQAKYIHDKYIDPPHTTDFGVLYLPIEGLYAEVTRQLGLCEQIQQEYQIVVMGPNTVAAFLNSLQMGFRTLAIEKKTSEVWDLLGDIKNQFRQFEEAVVKTQKKLTEASNTINKLSVRTRAVHKRISSVESLSTTQGDISTPKLLFEPDLELEQDEEDNEK